MRQIDADDADDELPALRLRRPCAKKGCRRTARDGGRHCLACHAAVVDRWRSQDRPAINARRRGRADLRDADARAKDSARAKLAMAIRRGKITKGICIRCGSADVTAIQADPRRPLEVVWVCRRDREAELGARAEHAAAAAEAKAWACRRADAFRRFKALPADDRNRLEDAARRGPIGTLSLSSPLYEIRLVQLVEKLG